MFESGKWSLGRIRWLSNAELTIHWTVLLAALFVGGWPPSWRRTALVLLTILVHELGHALFVRWRGLTTLEIQVHGFGGVCVHESGHYLDNVIIAWGGVVAQAVVLLPVGVFAFAIFPPNWAFPVASVFVSTNLFLIVFNLLPIPPLDGHLAWKLPGLLWRRRAPRRERKPTKARGRSDAAEEIPPRSAAASPEETVARATQDAEAAAAEIARRALEAAKRSPTR